MGLLRTLPGAERYSFKVFGAEQGLLNLKVTALCQDRAGFLWVGTESGLYRYDGHRFQSFSTGDGLPDASITVLHEGSDATLWVGTAHGLAWKSGARFVAAENEELREMIWGQAIASRPDGQVLLATGKGLATTSRPASGAKLSLQYLPRRAGTTSARATSIFVEPGAVWFGCGNAICRWDDKGVQLWDQLAPLPGETWQFVTRDSTGTVWARSRARLLKLEPGAAGFQAISPSDVGGQNYVFPMVAFDDSGSVMVSTNIGLAILKNGTWRRVGRRQGLPVSVVTRFLRDREGSLWVGTSAGLARWAGYGAWESYTSVEGLSSDEAYTLLQDPTGEIWVGSGEGLSHGALRDGAWSWTGILERGLAWINSLARSPDGAIWMTTVEPQVVRYDPATRRTQRFGHFDEQVFYLFIDSTGRLWVTTTHGLFRADTVPPFAGFERVRPDDSASNTVFTRVVEDTHHDLWFGTFSGLFRYSNGKWFHYRKGDGLSSERTAYLTAAPTGEIVVTYLNEPAVDRIRVAGDKVQVDHVDRSKGLSADHIYRVYFDHQGRWWAGTDRGLALRQGENWIHFDQDDGLIGNDCNSLLGAADDTIWVATGHGLTHFRPPAVPPSQTPPSVFFSEIRTGKRLWDVGEPLAAQRTDSIRVQFSALQLAHSSRIQYRYRCIGFNESWSELPAPEVRFDYLPPGHYRLDVQARWPLSGWSETPASLSFDVLPRWFESLWFRALVLAIMACAVWLLFLLRVRRLAAARVALEQQVAERTAELRASNEQLRKEVVERERAHGENRRLQEELLQAKKLESIGRLAGGVAHDFNNLLTVTNGYCDLLLTGLDPRNAMYDSLSEVRRAGERAAELTRRLLAFSRKQMLQPRPVSLKEVVGGMEASLRRLLRDNIILRTELDSECELVMVDRAQIEDVITHLAGNARDAIDGAGRVTITVRGVRFPEDGPPPQPDLASGEFVLLSVSDNGHGMDEATLANVFEPFFTTKDVGKGTGLGLAMVHGIVKQSGGWITVESAPGQGTTFRIFLPRVAADVARAPAFPADTRQPSAPHSILMVEDKDEVRRFTVAILRQAGYTVREAADGTAALGVLDGLANPVDLLITDIIMPFMTGIELARRVGERWPKTRVLFISGYAAEDAVPPGARYLAKPFTPDQLLTHVREMMQDGTNH